MRALLIVLLAGCASSNPTASARKDMDARVTAARPSIDACYQEALKVDPNLKGTMVVAFTAQAGSGQFIDVVIKSDEIGDPNLQSCVIEKVSALRLARPTKTAVQLEHALTFP